MTDAAATPGQPGDARTVPLALKDAVRRTGFSEKHITRKYRREGNAGHYRYLVPEGDFLDSVEVPNEIERTPARDTFAIAMGTATSEYIALLQRMADTERETRIALQEALRARIA